ncbi:MAG: TonB-dependent receptor, partial [Candidatus Cloacimonetes bacterium]|nr:TonB-dependent receptor [Candidatus Cloacimonadota bacterium]
LLTSIVFTPTTVDFSERDPVTGEFVVRATTFPNPLEVAERWLTPQEVSRFVGSFQARANPLPDLTLEYRLGYDTYNMQTRLFIPRGTPAQPLGESNDVARSQYLINNDLIANYRFGIGESVDLTTSVGVNHTYTNEETVNALVTDLPLFVDLARGANQSVSQSRFETATLGYFVQQQIGFADRFFLTGALRFDASSTFGEDERWQLFPKLSGSWVVSEESFFADGALGNLFSSFRLRGAFGYAGNQPPVGSAYARFPRYQNTINIDRTGLTHLGNPGNPALKPERQREWEAGFDASVLDDRVGIAFTYYDQHIEDLLLSRVFAPSTGYTSILDNVGVMTNKGVELQLTGVIMDRPGFGWNATMNYSRNRNKVVELAGGDFTVGYLNRVAEGKPLGIFFGSGYERDANGNVVYDEIGPVRAATSQYIGDPNPDWQGSLLNEFRIGRNVRINFLLDGMFGHDMWNQTVRIMDTFAAGPLAEKVSRGEISQDTRARIQGMFEPYVEDATYVKLRQLTLTYDISDWAGRLGLSNASVEVGGRNLYTWTDYTGYDPEINMFGTNTVERGVDFAVYPNPRQFTFGVRMSY